MEKHKGLKFIHFSRRSQASLFCALSILSTMSTGCTPESFPEQFDTIRIEESYELIDFELKLDATQVDILMMMDASPSMANNQDYLAQQFSNWVKQDVKLFENLCFNIADFNAYLDFNVNAPPFVGGKDAIYPSRHFCTFHEEGPEQGKMKSESQILEEATAALTIYDGCLPSAGCDPYQACDPALGNCDTTDVDNELLHQSTIAAIRQNELGLMSELALPAHETFYQDLAEFAFGPGVTSSPFYAQDPFELIRSGTEKFVLMFFSDETNQNMHSSIVYPTVTNLELKDFVDNWLSLKGIAQEDFTVKGLTLVDGQTGPENFVDLVGMLGTDSEVYDGFVDKDTWAEKMFNALTQQIFNPVYTIWPTYTQEEATIVLLLCFSDGTEEQVPDWAITSNEDGSISLDHGYVDSFITLGLDVIVKVIYYPDSLN